MELRHLGAMALMLVVAAVVISIGATILSDLQKDQCEDAGGTYSNGACAGYETYAVNASGQGLESMETLGDWLPLIALVVAAAIVIGVIVGYLGRS